MSDSPVTDSGQCGLGVGAFGQVLVVAVLFEFVGQAPGPPVLTKWPSANTCTMSGLMYSRYGCSA